MSLNTSAGGRLVAADDVLQLTVGAFGGVGVQITGTFAATLVFEGSADGTTFTSIQVTNRASGVGVTSATAAGQWSAAIAGLTLFRVRCSAYTSGTAWVTISANEAAGGGGAGGGGGGGAVTIADGADVAEGSTTDAAVTGDNDGSVNAHLRGLDKIFADVWDSVGHTLGVDATFSGGTVDQGTAGASAWLVTGTGGTFPVTDSGGSLTVDAASLPLPTGASTAAKQPALGTAGTASVDVITVQGIASMTPLLVNGSGVTQPVSAASLPLPTGASTLAEQQTQTTALQLLDDSVATVAAAVPTKGLAVAGTDGTNARLLKTDTSGELQVDVLTLPALAAGTNNIGDVDVLSIAAGDNNIGNVDVVTLPATPAGTNLIGKVSASGETSTIYDGTTALTPKFAVIDAAASGDNTLVAAVSSKKIRVTAAFLVAAGTVTVRFESGAGGTALTGQMSLVANTGFVLPYNPTGWFETAATTLLNLELSGAVSVDGSLQYVEV